MPLLDEARHYRQLAALQDVAGSAKVVQAHCDCVAGFKASLLSTKKPWCDFVIFTNCSDLQNAISVERIYFDEELWRGILEFLVYFYKAAIIPELITRRVKRLGFLYTTGAGYASLKRYKEGFNIIDHHDEALKLTLRKLK
ncbi:hypothetical protein HPB48_001459 [Haemaphysalis longicornis]|uniref:Uncharacterized protein n=1 Tax=Haemaphysalis longicornis TaxID=44386 RepID=A0A9J6F7A5_HAELO|nr:hypothetical protein HPB48_001459 [Haemaphysalis longicornis]